MISTLAPRLLTLLRYLAEHPDSVISRDTLIEAVWGHLEAASDYAVNVAVSSLRQAIGDSRGPIGGGAFLTARTLGGLGRRCLR